MIGFLTQEALGFPYWAWFAIILGIACILIAVIIIACVAKGKKGDGDEPETVQTQEDKQEAVKEEKPAEVKEEVKEVKEEKPAEVKEEVKEVKQEKPAESASKPEEKEKEEKKESKPSAKKSTSAKTNTAKTNTAKTNSAKTNTAKQEDSPAAKVYHVSKRKEDGRWQVKAQGADKALKLFLTQNEAIEYAKKVAGNQEGRVVIHKEGGGFRKLTY